MIGNIVIKFNGDVTYESNSDWLVNVQCGTNLPAGKKTEDVNVSTLPFATKLSQARGVRVI